MSWVTIRGCSPPTRLSASPRPAQRSGAKLLPLASNPIDAIWEDQPKRPTASLSVQPLQFAGQSVAEKLAMIAKLLGKAGADATVLTQPDSVAWVFNIRGHDVPYTPVVLAYAILKKRGKAELFIDKIKLPEDVQAHLKKSVTIKKPAEFESSLKALGKSTVQIDANWAPAKIKLALAKAKIINATDLCICPRRRRTRPSRKAPRRASARRRRHVALPLLAGGSSTARRSHRMVRG